MIQAVLSQDIRIVTLLIFLVIVPFHDKSRKRWLLQNIPTSSLIQVFSASVAAMERDPDLPAGHAFIPMRSALTTTA